MHVPSFLYDYWLFEDVGYLDLTTHALGISNEEGVAEVYLREEGVVCGLEEASEIYKRVGAKVEVLVNEGTVTKGLVLRAYGKAGALHKAWRVAQNIIAISSGIATYTKMMKDKLKAINPNAELIVVRKAPPCRAIFYKGVICGGGILHRTNLSDTIILFKNHMAFITLEKALEKLEEYRRAGKQVIVEAESVEEAKKIVERGFDVQLDHLRPEEVVEVVKFAKKVGVKVFAAGGITLENVELYAITDAILTSAPYRAKPLDVTTKMRALKY